MYKFKHELLHYHFLRNNIGCKNCGVLHCIEKGNLCVVEGIFCLVFMSLVFEQTEFLGQRRKYREILVLVTTSLDVEDKKHKTIGKVGVLCVINAELGLRELFQCSLFVILECFFGPTNDDCPQ